MAALVAEEVVALEAAGGGRALLAAEAGDGDGGGGAGRAARIVLFGVVGVVVARVVGVLTAYGADGVLQGAAGGVRPDVVGHGGRRCGGGGRALDLRGSVHVLEQVAEDVRHGVGVVLLVGAGGGRAGGGLRRRGVAGRRRLWRLGI